MLKRVFLLGLVSLLLMCVVVPVSATVTIEEEEYHEVYITIPIENKNEILILTRIVSIDDVTDHQVFAYVAQNSQLDALVDRGYSYTIIPVQHATKDIVMAHSINDMVSWDRYPTYDVYVAMMEKFATDYPDICKLYEMGTSQLDRKILSVKISDNVEIEENEPEFFYTGTMHGDELTGFVLLLRLIDYLLTNYPADAEVASLVNNLEIWINPNANPDGTYHGGNDDVSESVRTLDNGVDPNRNFPDPQKGPHPHGEPWAPETILMMDFAEAHSITLSANFHGGAEVVNYPWDTWQRLHTDNEWYFALSRAYADTAHANSVPGYMTSYNNGITNGYQWYPTHGCRQDYMNYFHGAREVTIELSDEKKLPSNLLPAYWNYNKRSMINYMKACFHGIHGVVTNSEGAPISATISVNNYDYKPDNPHVFTDPDVGDYHRMLLPGTYDITVQSPLYLPKTIHNIVVTQSTPAIVDVVLEIAEIVTVHGYVRDGDTQDILSNAVVQLVDNPDICDTTDSNGRYELPPIAEGEYEFRVWAPGYSEIRQQRFVQSENLVQNFYMYNPDSFWDFEINDGNFVSNQDNGWQWGVPTDIPMNGNGSVWGTVLAGNYEDNADWCLTSPLIQLPNNPQMHFSHYYDFEKSGNRFWDGGNVEISVNNGASFSLITPVDGYDADISALSAQGFGGTSDGWNIAMFDLQNYAGQTVQFRWHFASDGSNNQKGWYIDDVSIFQEMVVDIPENNHMLSASIYNYPNPVSVTTTFVYNLPREITQAEISIFNIRGQRVRRLSLDTSVNSIEWDGKNQSGNEVRSGVYLYKLILNHSPVDIKKLILIK